MRKIKFFCTLLLLAVVCTAVDAKTTRALSAKANSKIEFAGDVFQPRLPPPPPRPRFLPGPPPRPALFGRHHGRRTVYRHRRVYRRRH